MPDSPRQPKSNRQQNKDRVLQARIPEQLDDELRGRAEQLGLSVSTIVRNVLLHTFDLVEGVVTDSSQIARALTGHESGHQPGHDSPHRPAHQPAAADQHAEPAVIGWQEAILNQNGVCEECNVILPKGQRAAIGVPAGSRAALLCLECLSALSPSSAEPTQPAKPAKKAAAKKTRQRPSKSAATRKSTATGRKKSGK